MRLGWLGKLFTVVGKLLIGTIALLGVTTYVTLGLAFVLVCDFIAYQCGTPKPEITTTIFYWAILTFAAFGIWFSKKKD